MILIKTTIYEAVTSPTHALMHRQTQIQKYELLWRVSLQTMRQCTQKGNALQKAMNFRRLNEYLE